jgi:hypothetical protein
LPNESAPAFPLQLLLEKRSNLRTGAFVPSRCCAAADSGPIIVIFAGDVPRAKMTISEI